MNVFRWLMKHPIMLAWLVALTAILLNFGTTGKTSNDHKEAATPADAVQQAAPVAAATSVDAVAQAQPAAVVEAPVAPAAVEVSATPAVAEAPVAPAAPAAVEAPVAPAAPAAVEAPVAPAAPAVVEAPVAPAEASSEADLLRAAREAYWSNEFDNAAGFYTSLLKQAPDSLQYKGELANVYWKSGNAQQAAALFVELAPQLRAQGRANEAHNMRLYVEMVDPELAKQIK
ncbi:hypothetical protein [Candidatus Thiothrix anitrata]|jgi:hypothetical protein|uniref:Tetratricopeptide repeat protein n=1 Tax=Candidatus Thiothrix anitrata TaxID=2823902 RepID=A0ABX7X728_9GAMM|nr:hypothetical protein [Candidatus Thiothrix anitrata]QTR50553.1 hypothetical protein J8380_03000 [Candidatus Thiothrix anitrata]